MLTAAPSRNWQIRPKYRPRGHRLALGTLFVAVLLLSAGCVNRKDRLITFDGIYFKARTGAVDKKVSLADFTTTIQGVSRSLDGARQAGRYEATKYCIEKYGTSKVKWSVGPDTPVDRLSVNEDTLTFSGRCNP